MVIARTLKSVLTLYVLLALGGSVGQGAPSLNDDFFRAEPLGNTRTGTITGSNLEATAQSGEPSVNSGGRSVWYHWFAPSSGTAVVHIVTAEFPTLLASFTEPRSGGFGPAGVVVVATNASGESSLTFPTEAGTGYWVAVDGVSGATGTFTLA